MKKWELKSEDFWNAKNYISRKLEKKPYGVVTYLQHIEDWEQREKAIKEFTSNTRNARALQEWIEKYLTDEQIRKLRIFVRVERSRRGKRLQNITITEDVREKLANFANRYNVTLSEAVDLLLKKYSDATI